MLVKPVLACLLVATTIDLVLQIQAFDHYCAESSSPTDLVVNSDPGQSEYIIPTAHDPTESISGHLRCTWKISARSADAAVVVLRGFKVSKDPGRRLKRSVMSSRDQDAVATMHYQLMGQVASGCSSHATQAPQKLESAEVFRVLQLHARGYLTVTYDQESNLNGTLPPGLMIQLVHKGFCTRDLVNFDRRCYGKLQVGRTLVDELRVINLDSKMVQLASFNSIGAIRQFLVTSRLEVVDFGLEMRSKEPLDLKQPVRIGLFYEKKTRSITYLSSADGVCQLKQILDPEKFPFTDKSSSSTHACGSLRVDELSGREVIEFWNCDTPLPTLISFAETAVANCSNCSEAVVNWISAKTKTQDDRMTGTLDATVSSQKNFIPSIMGMMAAIIALAAMILLVLFAIFMVMIFRVNRSTLHGNRNESAVPKETNRWKSDDAEAVEFIPASSIELREFRLHPGLPQKPKTDQGHLSMTLKEGQSPSEVDDGS